MINLLPQSIKESRSYGRKNVALFGYSMALLGTALATVLIMLVSLQFVGSEEPILRENLAKNQVIITELEKEIKGIEEVASRLATAKEISDLSISFSELIPKIGAVLPEGVILNALSFTGGATDPLQLDVDLYDASLAPILIRNLVESDLFEAADISSLSPRGGTDETTTTEIYQFTASITASFKGTAEATKKAAAKEAAKKAAADAAASNTANSKDQN